MLEPKDFFVGPITSVPVGLSLMLPRATYEHAILINRTEEKGTAIFLNGRYGVLTFTCGEKNQNWAGIIIPHVEITLDESSLFATDSIYPPFGALVREKDEITISVHDQKRFDVLPRRLSLMTGLTRCPDHFCAGFYKWQIVLGKQKEKRTLRSIEIQPQAKI